MITIRVPMSTSNLGPGFDCLGLALNGFNTYRFEANRKMELVGFPKEIDNTSNLAYQVYIDCYRKNNRPLFPVRITFLQEVPLCGGVGSSATAVLASIIAYHAFVGETINREELLLEALEYEHHPDNIAAAIYGGLTAAIITAQGVKVEKFTVNPEWKAMLLIPNMSLDTTKSRSVLPKTITLEDAVHNLGRGILIPEALKNGDEDLLASLLEDRWHEPYRLPLIEGAHAIIAYCRIRGIACFLSGAGASLCVLTKRDISLSFEGWETRVYEVSPTGLSYEK